MTDSIGRVSGSAAWEPMALAYVGHAGEILETSTGGGKNSPAPTDPGEPLKNRGQDTKKETL
jgi:hypothetical protein